MLGVVLMFSKNMTSGRSIVYEAPSNMDKLSEKVANQDKDSDGLKDWEEALWGSDSNNPDTDSDGTTDGVEVSAGRHPTIKGPKDKVSDILESAKKLPNPVNEDITATDKFAREFFNKYLALKRSGASVADNSDFLVNEVLKNNTVKLAVPVYKSDDITITNEEDVVTLKNYGNTLGRIIIRNSPKTDNEINIFERAVKREDESEIKKLDPIISGYEKIVEQSADVLVPKPFRDAHIEYLNALNYVIASIKGLRQIFSDPLIAISALGQYDTARESLENSIKDFGHIFKSHTIIFTTDEDGNALVPYD